MIPKVMTPNDKFIRFSSFCIEHAPLLRNHRDFGELMQNVYDEIKVMEDILFEKMPCGHLARYAVPSDEGTGFCALCELEASITVCQNCGGWVKGGECENCNSPYKKSDAEADRRESD